MECGRFSFRRAKVASPSCRRGRLGQQAWGSSARLAHACGCAPSYAWPLQVSTLFWHLALCLVDMGGAWASGQRPLSTLPPHGRTRGCLPRRWLTCRVPDFLSPRAGLVRGERDATVFSDGAGCEFSGVSTLFTQIPPDCVVKCQGIDIVDAIFLLLWRRNLVQP